MDDVVSFITKARIGKYLENVNLSTKTTYKVGGNAKIFVYPKNAYKVAELVKYLDKNEINYIVLGNGSNVIFSDKEYNGVIVKLDELDDVTINDTVITVGAGVNLQKLALLTSRKGLTGLEFAAGIPGQIGGAVYMNAGAYNSDMGYIVSKIKVIDELYNIKTIYNKDLNFHYRTSLLKQRKLICVEATLVLKHGDKKAILDVIEDRKQRRLMSQPLEYPSAGSVFRNPENNFAGKLIEDAGLKGKKIGGAMVSEKHANFIVNYDHAKAQDVKDLIELIQNKVKENNNIDLLVEQEYKNW